MRVKGDGYHFELFYMFGYGIIRREEKIFKPKKEIWLILQSKHVCLLFCYPVLLQDNNNKIQLQGIIL